ncbi:MAG: ABC transporter ATP-binding protein [Proteobacteria bacterium]|nr:ABC transporter ATP-binding protein [Pseudomonadota bacterium]
MLETNDLAVMIGDKVLLSDLSLAVGLGENWAILGANGTGKSSLLRLLAGIDKPLKGRILADGVATHAFPKKSLARQIGLLPQFEEDHYWGCVEEYVGLGRYSHATRLWGKSADDQIMTQRALEHFDILSLSGREYRSLSGGERQRVRLASLMAQDPKLFLWDEPLENLDYSGQMKFLSWVCDLTQKKDKASMMVVHDINMVNRFFTHTLMLFADGAHFSGTCSETLTLSNLEALYLTRFDLVMHDGARLFVPIC